MFSHPLLILFCLFDNSVIIRKGAPLNVYSIPQKIHYFSKNIFFKFLIKKEKTCGQIFYMSFLHGLFSKKPHFEIMIFCGDINSCKLVYVSVHCAWG